MQKKIFTLALLFLFAGIGHAQSDKIKIKSDQLHESNYLKKIDDFYLTHHLYLDLFLRESLFLEAGIEEVSSVLKAIKKYVSPGNSLEIEIEKPGKRNYKIKVGILITDDGVELLIAFTNWSAEKRIFEKGVNMGNNSYTRWYFLNDDKMTYRKNMSEENNYAEMNKIDLANAYLFDELSRNDNKIKGLINEVLEEKNINIEDKIMANLVLLKYYIFQRKHSHVNDQIENLNEIFENNKFNPDLKGLKIALETTEFQIELMK